MIELSWGEGTNKSHRYGELLRAIMTDQVAWIHDHSHARKITEDNGRDSLAVACAADRLAQASAPRKEPDMLLKRHFEKLLLTPADLKPLRDDFEVVGVFNPGAIVAGDEVILLVRVAERPRERREGFTALPRWSPGEGLVIDWVR